MVLNLMKKQYYIYILLKKDLFISTGIFMNHYGK